ncbi:MAG: bifunctional UDP-N-acetylglucosamine diphosphorylase/glucosamine-1-phosphate N-acetyltransferase GlmU [Thermoanaerobaculia bacterium]
MRPTAVVVLAAGRGVRMKSEQPKVLHEAAGIPLLGHVLATAAHAAGGVPRSVIVVVGAGRERVLAYLRDSAPDAVAVLQDPPRGTGDAVKCAVPALEDAEIVIVLSGDVPLLTSGTLDTMLARFEEQEGTAVAFLTAHLAEPAAYGRVVRDATGAVTRIVELKDASPNEREIREINAGVYAFDRAFLQESLPLLRDQNAAGEFYLTDLLGLGVAAGRPVIGVLVENPDEIRGVNSRLDLAHIEGLLLHAATDRAMAAGATLIRPETITLESSVVFEPDTIVEPFVTMRGKTHVGSGTCIGQGTVVKDAHFGKGVLVRPYCVIEGSRLEDGAVVGPFARLREGTELAEGAHVGNFVETKKARLGKGVKANHLTYLGDVTIGERTNVGAGVITCNYDGYAKHPTVIGSDVFVGSDVQLVAPVTVGNGAIIGAGTTVTKDVPADALATSRAPQKIYEAGGRKYHERKTKS